MWNVCIATWNSFAFEMFTHIHTTEHLQTHTYEMLAQMHVKHIHTLIYETLKSYKDE